MKAKRKQSATSNPSQETVRSRVHVSIHGEINHIIRRAQANDTRVVSIGPLILFSTENGDAWILDSDDGLALCLAEGGKEQAFKVTESGSDFGIEWTSTYRIEENRFVVSEKPEQTRTFLGYPTGEILKLSPKWG